MILLSLLAILFFILATNTLHLSSWSFAKTTIQCILVGIWFLGCVFSLYDKNKVAGVHWDILELVPLILGAATLLFFIYLNYQQMRRLRLEIETQKHETQEHVHQVEELSRIQKTTQHAIDSLNLQLDQASKIYKSTLAMSTSLDFHATLSAFVKSLSHLEGFKNLFLILTMSSDDSNGSRLLVSYQVSQKQKTIEAYSAGDAEKKLFQRIQTLPPIQLVSDPQSFDIPPSSFEITPENPAWIVPLAFLKECAGVLVYFHEQLLHPGPLEILSMHFSMEIQKTRLYEKIKRLSTIDTLSGAYLKRHFFSLFDGEIVRHKALGENLGVLMMDIDRFKCVNDQYGHLMGDLVIKEVGVCIKNGLREEDIICRFGGDEFVIVLPKSSKEQVFQVAERLQKSILEIPFYYKAAGAYKATDAADNQEEFRVSMSLGISYFPEDGVERETLIETADQRLYEFKKVTHR